MEKVAFRIQKLFYLWNGTKVTTEDQPEITHALLIGAKINDLGWSWRVIMHSVSKHMRHGVVIYVFNLLLGDKILQQKFNLMLAGSVL